MSLTSYRAAPPRVEPVCAGFFAGSPGVSGLINDDTALTLLGAFRGGVVVLFDRLEDLAATYSPVP